MRIQEDEEEILDIPLSSLMDAMFILIIFFVVTTTMKKVQRELPVELPSAATAVAASSAVPVLVVSIDAGGNRYIDGEAVTTSGLLDRLRDEAAADPNRRVRIDADREARYNSLVEVIEAVRLYGLVNIGFGTRPPSRELNP